MELLAKLLSLDFLYQRSEWEKQLIASGALHDGKVDVQLFVSASSADPDNDGKVDVQVFVSASSADSDAIVLPEEGLQFMAPISGTVSQTAALQAVASEISKTLSWCSDVQMPLPVPAVTVGAV
eukprot:6474018-Amphidinium_carterae.1